MWLLHRSPRPAVDARSLPLRVESLEDRCLLSGSGTHNVQWVAHTASSDMLEITLGTLAQANASNATVKAFGARMVSDHTNSLNQLTQVADSLNIPVPTEMDEQDQTIARKFRRLSGTAFDQTYSSYMVEDHHDDISSFQEEAANADNTALSTLATDTIPMLNKHLQFAKRTRAIGFAT